MRTKVLGIERAEDLSLLDNWPKTKNTFAICFGNDAELMEAAFQRHPDMNWIGASAAGQIRGREKVGSGISIELFELEESCSDGTTFVLLCPSRMAARDALRR